MTPSQINPRQIMGRIGLWFAVFVIVSPAILFFLLIVALAAVMLYMRQRTLWTEIASGA